MAPRARAEPIRIDTALETERAGDGGAVVSLRVAVAGNARAGRVPLNVALVIDRSAAMGPFLDDARRAVTGVFATLDPDDTVSLVTFDDTVEVLVESSRLGDLEAPGEALFKVTAGGNAGVFAGVVKGAFEVRKGLSRDRMNRVVLLTAARPSIGPRGDDEFAQLAASLRREGIAVSSIGIGLDYDEDALVTLAEGSGGHHIFVETSAGLARTLADGLAQLASVVARDVLIRFRPGPAVTAGRVIGRTSELVGGLVTVPMPAAYRGLTDDVVVEFDVGPGSGGAPEPVATIEVSYLDPVSGSRERFSETATAPTGDARPRDPGLQSAQACWRAHAARRQLLAQGDRDAEEAKRIIDAENTKFPSVRDGFRMLGFEFGKDGRVRLESGGWPRQRKLLSARECGPLGPSGEPSERGKARL